MSFERMLRILLVLLLVSHKAVSYSTANHSKLYRTVRCCPLFVFVLSKPDSLTPCPKRKCRVVLKVAQSGNDAENRRQKILCEDQSVSFYSAHASPVHTEYRVGGTFCVSRNVSIYG